MFWIGLGICFASWMMLLKRQAKPHTKIRQKRKMPAGDKFSDFERQHKELVCVDCSV
jgi:hypothetical protein